MRIASWYEDIRIGRNDGNPLYITSFLKRVQYFCDVLKKENVNKRLLAYFPNPDNPKDDKAKDLADFILTSYEDSIEIEHLIPDGQDNRKFGEFDINLWIDWGEDGLKGFLPYEPKFPDNAPVVYWASDTHLGYDYRLAMARKSDVVFCAQKKAAEEFKKEGLIASWLPHCFEPLAYPRFNLASKKYDVCFVGHVNSENRIDALDRLFSEFPNFFYGQRKFEEASKKYAESRIVFNHSMKDDLNMRVFEVLGSGNFLLTDDVSSMRDLFEDGTHLVLFDNLDEMLNKARHYIGLSEERSKIALNGYNEVLKNHTTYNRSKKIVETMFSLLGKEAKSADNIHECKVS